MGGEALSLHDLDIRRRPLIPLRYAASAAHTVAALVKRRPKTVIIQVPPVPAALIAWLWARATGTALILDTHPACFENSPADRLMRPLLARIVRDAAACLVTTPELGTQISHWGGHPAILHEAPMPWHLGVHSHGRSSEKVVLCVCTFAPDEPLADLLAAAHHLPDVTLRVTGDTRRLDAGLPRNAPKNVEWVGYLDSEEYVQALIDADVVATLTTRSDSVPRSAHEAVDAMRPVVISDRPHMRTLFPYAVLVGERPEDIAEGIRAALENYDALVAFAPQARELQHRRWDAQLTKLNDMISDSDAPALAAA